MVFAIGLAFSSFAACGGGGGGESGSDDPYFNGVTIDTTKTQLFVFNYNGGYGREWFYDVIDRFETKYENYEGVNGKKGVQIVPDTFNKTLGTSFERNMGNNEIYFTESAFYYKIGRAHV